MQDTILFSSDFYSKFLTTIRDVYFTKREIDLIACLVNVKGSSKKIAAFLSISPKTVQKHIENIMAKVGCNATDSIINFVETSESLSFLKKYYFFLQREMIFEKSLKEISKLNYGANLPYCFIQNKNNDFLVSHLKSHLDLMGCITSTRAHPKKGDSVIFILPQVHSENDLIRQLQKIKQKTNKIFILLREQNNKEISQALKGFDIIDFSKEENYYFSIFDLLKKLLPNLDMEKAQADFENQYTKVVVQVPFLQSPPNEGALEKQPTISFVSKVLPYQTLLLKLLSRSKTKRYFLSTLCVTIFVGSGFLALQWNQQHRDVATLRSDLILPKETAFLQRPELLKLIDDKFKGQEKIKTVALIGQGGAGKTTLARQYAHQQKASCLWEINAETSGSLQASFEKLAQGLAKADSDQKILKELFEIKDALEKEERVIQFVKEHLKSEQNWLLIYDNVEKFADIQKYFPNDAETWGTGRIILTTRDSNIESNTHVHHAVFIGELNPQQKLTLYTNIMRNRNPSQMTRPQIEEMKCFLEKIPSFPLDVSIAAYYLKATNASYSVYLENIAHYNKDFATLEENLLKEAGDYLKTRYGVITLSLQHIINTHKDFRDLLFLVSLIDSQNIPRELLAHFKNEVVVDSFIFNLRKYSLLINDSSNTVLSIHRSTQTISLAYLTKTLDLEKNKEHIENLCEQFGRYLYNFNNFESFVKTQDFSFVKLLIRHVEAFINHRALLTDNDTVKIKGELGSMYDCVTYFEKAQDLLKTTLVILEKMEHRDSHAQARILSHLGILYWAIGQYEIAQEYLEKSVKLYTVANIKNDSRLAKSLVYLGLCYAAQGNFEKALDVSKQSLSFYKKYFPNDEIGLAFSLMCLGNTYGELWQFEQAECHLKESINIYGINKHVYYGRALGYLGSVYRSLGRFDEAKNLMSETLAIYKQFYPKDGILVAWALRNLGSAYNDLKDYKRAQDLLEQSVRIYRNILGDDNVRTQWALFELGKVYSNICHLEHARNIFEKNLLFYEKSYKENHIWIARFLRNLGQVYFLEGNIKSAEFCMMKALGICKQHKNPEIYISYEQLAEFFLKKETLEKKKEYNQNPETNSREKAIVSLKQALNTVRAHFPKNSVIKEDSRTSCCN